MTTPTLTTPPPAPIRNDATTFSARFAAFLAWMSTFVTEETTAIDWIDDMVALVGAAQSDVAADALVIAASAAVAADAAGLVARSTSNLTVSAGTKTIHFTSTKPLLAVTTKQVAIVNISDPSVKMFGNIATSDGSDDITVTVTSGGVFGSGSYSNWLIIDAAFFTSGATAADILAATTDAAAITPKAQKDALARYTLTDGSPVTGLSGLNGLDFLWTLAANRTLPQLINTYPGARGTVTAKQDAVGSRLLAVHSSWKRRGGLGVLSTTANAEDEIPYEVKTVDGSGNATRVIYDVLRAPS